MLPEAGLSKVAMTQEVLPPKKKRGRPKKVAVMEEGSADPGPSTRPQEHLESDLALAAPRKRPGRPRKDKAKADGEDNGAEAGRAKDISQEDLNVKLKAAILADEALHLRVLRYEVSRLPLLCFRDRAPGRSDHPAASPSTSTSS